MTIYGIRKAIIARIRSALTDTAFAAVAFDDADVSEPIRRPSLKLTLEDGTAGRFNGCCAERTVTARVHFFAKSETRPTPENTAMRELLENAFLDDLLADGGAIPIDEISSVVTDGFLICSFDLYRVELLPEGDSPTMETLNINERVN